MNIDSLHCELYYVSPACGRETSKDSLAGVLPGIQSPAGTPKLQGTKFSLEEVGSSQGEAIEMNTELWAASCACP